MGVWDKTTPLGSDLKSQGDDRIRELKDALEEALSHEYGTFPGATPGSTPIFIPGFQRGATGARPTGDSLVEGRIYFNTTTNVIERYNGATWDDILSTPGADSIDGSMIADDVIDSEHYVGGSIDNEHLAADSVDSAQYVDGSIDPAHLAADAVETAKILDANVTEAKLASEVVTKLGQNIGIVPVISYTDVTRDNVFRTVLDYTGQGRFVGMFDSVSNFGTTGSCTVTFRITMDGTAYSPSYSFVSGGAFGYTITSEKEALLDVQLGTTDLHAVVLFFRTGLKIEVKAYNSSGDVTYGTRTLTIKYERQA